jgi:pyrroloquinoline-quinone synthase
MKQEQFWSDLEARIAKYDLLCHAFYQAWANGDLTHEDLREYAAEYYHQVVGFPAYLAVFATRLPEGELRQAVLENFRDEMGRDAPGAHPHHAMWLDFAAGVGASVAEVRTREPIREVRELVEDFRKTARTGSEAEALAAFYAYESQVPRVAREKAHGLGLHYAADEKTRAYFTLHQTADIHHAHVWKEQLARVLDQKPEQGDAALAAAEKTARALWRALDGIERQRRDGWSSPDRQHLVHDSYRRERIVDNDVSIEKIR